MTLLIVRVVNVIGVVVVVVISRMACCCVVASFCVLVLASVFENYHARGVALARCVDYLY